MKFQAYVHTEEGIIEGALWHAPDGVWPSSGYIPAKDGMLARRKVY